MIDQAEVEKGQGKTGRGRSAGAGGPRLAAVKSEAPDAATHQEIVVYLCRNCIPRGAKLPRQWRQEGARVAVREAPCTGKMDGQYIMHALEAGLRGICVVACPKGSCSLGQGNYRAEMRVNTVRRLLEEIGVETGRAELLHCGPEESPERFEEMVREAAGRIAVLGESPIKLNQVKEEQAKAQS